MTLLTSSNTDPYPAVGVIQPDPEQATAMRILFAGVTPPMLLNLLTTILPLFIAVILFFASTSPPHFLLSFSLFGVVYLVGQYAVHGYKNLWFEHNAFVSRVALAGVVGFTPGFVRILFCPISYTSTWVNDPCKGHVGGFTERWEWILLIFDAVAMIVYLVYWGASWLACYQQVTKPLARYQMRALAQNRQV